MKVYFIARVLGVFMYYSPPSAAVKEVAKEQNRYQDVHQEDLTHLSTAKQGSSTTKAKIPDLNFPPPSERGSKTFGKDDKNKVKYTRRIQKLIEKGTHENFQKAEKKRFKVYYANLTPERKRRISQRNQSRLDERLAESEELRKSRKLYVAAANQRYRARKKAEKHGLTEKPEHSLKNQSTQIVLPSNPDAPSKQ